MFFTCSSLTTIPLLNTAAGTTFTSMFNLCKLITIPLLNTAAGTGFGTMFGGCSSLVSGATTGATRAIAYNGCKLSQTALQDIIDGLGSANSAGLVLNISSNWGAVTPVTLTGTTTVGSVTVTMASTTGIVVGMQITGAGTPSTTTRAVTFTDAGDLVSLTAHGLSDTDKVAFASITGTTGIVVRTIYFVVGAAANTFPLALTSGGAAIVLTTNGSGTLNYKAEVSSIAVNTSVTLDRPASANGTVTLSFRDLKTNTALLKGWAVTG